MLAEDKLGEAESFLKKMKLCREGSGEFRYYLSALLSALVPSDKSFPYKHIGQMRGKSLPNNGLSMKIAASGQVS